MPEPEEPRESESQPQANWFADLRLAAAFLTRLVPPPDGDGNGDGGGGGRPLAQAVRVFPLIGAALGLGASVIYMAAYTLGLPPTLAAICALAALVAATGALHEDGLADVADGFGGGADAKAKLAIMRDSRAGAFAVVAVVFSIVVRVAAIAALAEPGPVAAALIAAAACSRAAMPAVMLNLDAARADGLGAAAGKPESDHVVIGAGIAAALALMFLGFWAGIVAVAVCALATMGVAALARRQIGGHTGDVLGTVQQAAEIAVLLVAVALQ